MCWLVSSSAENLQERLDMKCFAWYVEDRFCARVDIHVGLLGCSGWSLLKFKIATVQGTCLLNNIFYLFIYFYFKWTAMFAKNGMALPKAQLKLLVTLPFLAT